MSESRPKLTEEELVYQQTAEAVDRSMTSNAEAAAGSGGIAPEAVLAGMLMATVRFTIAHMIEGPRKPTPREVFTVLLPAINAASETVLKERPKSGG